LNIAILDSGIDISHKKLFNCKVDGVSINDNEQITENNYFDENGHGTSVAVIIHKFVPDVKLIIVKIFHGGELIAREEATSKAIQWCIDQKNIDIINLSLGVQTSSPSSLLYEVCKSAFRNNIVICAAGFYIPDKECYPAFFPEVFGVISGNVRNKYQYGYSKNSPIEFIAKGSMQRVAVLNNKYAISEGSSLACANFTGIVASIIKKEKIQNIKDLKEYLIHNAYKNIDVIAEYRTILDFPKVISSNIDNIATKYLNFNEKFREFNNLALFPISEKEVNSFLEFPDHSCLSINKYFDYPRNVSVTTTNDKYSDIEIQDWQPNESELNSFDSIILGYFRMHLFQGNVIYGNTLLGKVLQLNKNIITFDPGLKRIIEEDFSFYKKKVYCPSVGIKVFNDFINFRYLPKIKTPVIAVIGTSNRQGKFTTQLRIKEILNKEGYKVSHLSTEPQGEFLGADFSFPYGYHSSVEIKSNYWSFFINNVMKAIEYYKKPNVIISGTQGGIIHLVNNINEPNSSYFDALHFLRGIQPDAIICMINPNDNIERINNIVNLCRITLRTEILFYAMTPWIREHETFENTEYSNYYTLDKNEKEKKIGQFSKQLNSKVIDIMNDKNDKFILDSIESFFTTK